MEMPMVVKYVRLQALEFVRLRKGRVSSVNSLMNTN